MRIFFAIVAFLISTIQQGLVQFKDKIYISSVYRCHGDDNSTAYHELRLTANNKCWYSVKYLNDYYCIKASKKYLGTWRQHFDTLFINNLKTFSIEKNVDTTCLKDLNKTKIQAENIYSADTKEDLDFYLQKTYQVKDDTLSALCYTGCLSLFLKRK